MERFHERDPNHNPRRKKADAWLWELGPTPRTHREAEADNPAWQLET